MSRPGRVVFEGTVDHVDNRVAREESAFVGEAEKV